MRESPARFPVRTGRYAVKPFAATLRPNASHWGVEAEGLVENDDAGPGAESEY